MQDTCLIIPCYNEEKRLPVTEIQAFLGAHPEIALCFVNDGSKDNTLEILERLKQSFPDKVYIQDLKRNQGKAEAVRQGILAMLEHPSFSFLGYFDADLATPLAIAGDFKAKMEGSSFQWVFGSRILTVNSQINRKPYRHYFGRIIATLISLQLQLEIYDTQCGAKLFRREICEGLFAKPFISPWLFDVELFHRMIRQIGRSETKQRIFEYALPIWTDRDESKITFLDMLKVPFHLFYIFLHYRKK
jgi:glycosyltransferase involved in cell wall biosynthesis